MMKFHAFANWSDLLVHIDSGKGVYYMESGSPAPRYVYACRAFVRSMSVKVTPPGRDPFLATMTHLNRFSYRGGSELKAPTSAVSITNATSLYGNGLREPLIYERVE